MDFLIFGYRPLGGIGHLVVQYVIGSIYKGKAIYSSVNKGGYINSISILKYYI